MREQQRERERGIEEGKKVMEGEKETTVWSEPKREREREKGNKRSKQRGSEKQRSKRGGRWETVTEGERIVCEGGCSGRGGGSERIVRSQRVWKKRQMERESDREKEWGTLEETLEIPKKVLADCCLGEYSPKEGFCFMFLNCS